jgi:DNA-binding NarL/FixJ family response regulator
MKILLVDDHVLIREALRGVLTELKREATIVEAGDWRQAMRQIEQNADVELILLDLKLPDRDGFDVLAELREHYPAIGVIVLSGYHDRERVMKALDLGALGFIPKSAQRQVMLSAFNLVFRVGSTSRPTSSIVGSRHRRRHLLSPDRAPWPAISG